MSLENVESVEDTRPIKPLHAPEYEDTYLGRSLRAIGQHKVETSFEKHRGMSVLERCIDIREKLFSSFSSLHGAAATRPREVLVSTSLLTFSESDRVQEVFLPGYTKLLDNAYDTCLEEPSARERSSMGKRLAALSYNLGILMHPYTDGNGQTFRLVSMSYLKEFCPAFADKQFKFKLRPGGALQKMSLVEEDSFQQRMHAEEAELREFDVLTEIKSLVPDLQRGIPFSIDGLKVFLMAKKLNPSLKGLRDTCDYLIARDVYLEENIKNNDVYVKRVAKQKLQEISSLRGGFIYPTAGADGVYRLNPLSHRDESTYWDIVSIIGDSPEDPVRFANALEKLAAYEKAMKIRLEQLEDAHNRKQQRELESFLEYVVSPKGVSDALALVRGTPVSNAPEATLLAGMVTTFVHDIDSPKSPYLDTQEEHERFYQENIIRK